MTVFNASTDLPASINSLEKLALWVGLALNRLNPTLAHLEDPNIVPEKAAQMAIRRFEDGNEYMIIRVAIKLDETYKTDNSRKIWTFAEDLSNVALLAGFKS